MLFKRVFFFSLPLPLSLSLSLTANEPHPSFYYRTLFFSFFPRTPRSIYSRRPFPSSTPLCNTSVDGNAEAARELFVALQGSGSEGLPGLDDADVVASLVEGGDGAAERRDKMLLAYARVVAASDGADASAHADIARLLLPTWKRKILITVPEITRAEATEALIAAASLGGCFGCAAHAAMAVRVSRSFLSDAAPFLF